MKSAVSQRRPAFDRENGVKIAQALFHARGYEAVSIADLTQALSIVPPSFYAAYGSKLELFKRAMVRYVETEALPIEQLLSSPEDPPEVLTQLFIAAAQHYTRDPKLRGCMVTEAMRSDDKDAAALATALAEAGTGMIRRYIAKHALPKDVDRIVDYMLLNLRGLSSYACLGYSGEKLVECSKIAGRALQSEFPAGTKAKNTA